MWQFVEVVEGLAEACTALGTPITGGNVSLYNETLGQGIYPTPVVGVVGMLRSPQTAAGSQPPRPMTPHFRHAGRSIVLLDASPKLDATEHWRRFGGSEYANVVLEDLWGLPPAIDLGKEKALQDCLRAAIANGWIESAHDISEGGLAICLVESCLMRPIEGPENRLIGAAVDIPSPLDDELALFDETGSRIVISCTQECVEALHGLAREYGIAAVQLGTTLEGAVSVSVNGRHLIEEKLPALAAVWGGALEHLIAGRALAAS
jgi:phosphoribosylformylglycinamidine synthase